MTLTVCLIVNPQNSQSVNRKESELIRALKDYSFHPTEETLKKMLYYYRGYERYFDFTKHMRFFDSRETLHEPVRRDESESPDAHHPWGTISDLILNSSQEDFNEMIASAKNIVSTAKKKKGVRAQKRKRILPTREPLNLSVGAVNAVNQ